MHLFTFVSPTIEMQDTYRDKYTYALQNKPIPNFPTFSPELLQSQFLKNPHFVEKLQNAVVDTVSSIPPQATVAKREELKRKSYECELEKSLKNAKVTSDSMAESEGRAADREYCILPPITVKTNNGELVLLERTNKRTLTNEPQNQVLVLTPPQQPISSNEESMSSVSSTGSQKKKKKKSKSLSTSSNDKTSDSSEGSDIDSHETNVPDVKITTELERELLKQSSFDNLEIFREHFEHAYECESTRGGDCQLAGCRGQETKDYVEREIKNIKEENVDMSENRKQIVYTLFHHAMDCQSKICAVPLCKGFREKMKIVSKDYNNSANINGKEMNVLFSNTSYFNGGDGIPKVEGRDFSFNLQKFLNKGSFGYVYDSWLVTSQGESRVAVKKSGPGYSKQHLNVNIEPFKELQKSPHLLFPDVILSSNGGLSYLLMEKAETSLSELIKIHCDRHDKTCGLSNHFNNPPCCRGLSTHQTSLYFYQMAQGLEYLHEHNYTHGDIKCENVLVMNGHQDVKLCDFDFLKKEDMKMTSGTPGYVAQEVFTFGNVLKSSDVYSLTCCIPEMLFGFPMKVSQENNRNPTWMATRASELFKILRPFDEHLSVIFCYGMHNDYLVRPTIRSIVKCFERNAEMRERKQTIVDHVTSSCQSHINDSYQSKDDPLDDMTLPVKLVDHWIEDIMNHMSQSLPPINMHPDETMECTNIETCFEDIPLMHILSQQQ